MFETRLKILDPSERKYINGMPDNTIVLVNGFAVLETRYVIVRDEHGQAISATNWTEVKVKSE